VDFETTASFSSHTWHEIETRCCMPLGGSGERRIFESTGADSSIG
jgi:hypothetical protein